jgi:hypothetical protein
MKDFLKKSFGTDKIE